jgi:hypothetical protein
VSLDSRVTKPKLLEEGRGEEEGRGVYSKEDASKEDASKEDASKEDASKEKRVTFPRVKLDQQVKQWYNPASVVETLEGLKNADEIVKVPGVQAIFAVSSDFGNFAGYKRGDPDYEREINIVHDAAIKAGMKLCGPWAWKDRGLHPLPGRQRDGGHRPRRKDRAWRVCGYAG